MKIRIQNNDIRFRLNRLEVDEFNEKNRLVSETEFGPGNRLGYILEKDNDLNYIKVYFENQNITIRIPSKMVTDWVENESSIVLESEPHVNKNPVHVIVEKDLQRLSKQHKASANSFPNPMARRRESH